MEGHSAVERGGTVYVFGGKTRSEKYSNEVVEYSFNANHSIASSSAVRCSGDLPTPRAYHTATLWRNRYMIVLGGVGEEHLNGPSGKIDDVWVLDLDTMCWRGRRAGGDAPMTRCHHTVNLVPGRDTLLLYGGYPVGKEGEQMFISGKVQPHHRSFFEVYELNLGGAELVWRRLPCREEFPPTLWGHTATLYQSNLIVFGGVDVVDNKESNLACVWHCERMQWRWVEFNRTPQGRSIHSTVAANGQLLVFGGFGNTNTCKFNDTWEFSLDTGQWTELATGGVVPSPRSGHTAVLLGPLVMIVIGGVDSTHTRLDDLHSLDLKTGMWSQIPNTTQVQRSPPTEEDTMASVRQKVRAGLGLADSLLTRTAAQQKQFEELSTRHWPDGTQGKLPSPAPSVSPGALTDRKDLSPSRITSLPRRHDKAPSPPPVATPTSLAHTQAAPYPPRPTTQGIRRIPSPQLEMVQPDLNHITPYTDQKAKQSGEVSPMRQYTPPPPPPEPVRASTPLSTQAVQTDLQPPQHSPGGKGERELHSEAANIIQQQRMEIEFLRASLEKRHTTPPAASTVQPYAELPLSSGAPPAPMISLTKDTIADLMPRVNLNITDTPLLRRSTSQGSVPSGLLSREATQALIERRLGEKELIRQFGSSPLLNPSLLPTAPIDSTRHTTQRRDLGLAVPHNAVYPAPSETKQPPPPPPAAPPPLDLLKYDPLNLFTGNPGPTTTSAIPPYHPNLYKPPQSYAELMARVPADQSTSLPPGNYENVGEVAPQPVAAPPPPSPKAAKTPRQHKSPSLSKIVNGRASMLSITHIPV